MGVMAQQVMARQEGWGVSINSQVLVLCVRHQLRLRVLVVAWALTAWFHASGLCGNHGGTITAHCQMSPDFKLTPANGYEACLEGFYPCQVPRTPQHIQWLILISAIIQCHPCVPSDGSRFPVKILSR